MTRSRELCTNIARIPARRTGDETRSAPRFSSRDSSRHCFQRRGRRRQGHLPVDCPGPIGITSANWLRRHDAAILGSDAAEDVHPSDIDGIAEPIHALVLIATVLPIFDNLDLEAVNREAARRNRWDFLVTSRL
jgi:hypothetical protein